MTRSLRASVVLLLDRRAVAFWRAPGFRGRRASPAWGAAGRREWSRRARWSAPHKVPLAEARARVDRSSAWTRARAARCRAPRRRYSGTFLLSSRRLDVGLGYY